MAGTPRSATALEVADLLKIAARAVYTVSGPVIVDGAVLIGEDGRIAEVGTAEKVSQPESAGTVELPDTILMPGLVNLHTHLELTALGGRIEEDDFFQWIQHVRNAKAELALEAFRESAGQGVRDGWRWGITTVADTGDSGAVVDALTDLGGRGVVYQEVFGPHPADAAEAFAALEKTVEELIVRAGDSVRIGVSPHAPYTVSRPLYRLVVEFAKSQSLPVAVHIAESHAEVDLVTQGKGQFAEAWSRRGIPEIATARSPVAYLHELGVLREGLLAVHAVQTDLADAKLLGDHGCSVALCPQSNVRHGHGAPPIGRFREAGLAMGLGTDSVASVGSLDLFREMRHVRRLGGLSAAEVIELATLAGARALGLEGQIGSLEVGKWADMCVLRMAPGGWSSPETMAEGILDTAAGDVVQTYVAGRCVYDAC